MNKHLRILIIFFYVIYVPINGFGIVQYSYLAPSTNIYFQTASKIYEAHKKFINQKLTWQDSFNEARKAFLEQNILLNDQSFLSKDSTFKKYKVIERSYYEKFSSNVDSNNFFKLVVLSIIQNSKVLCRHCGFPDNYLIGTKIDKKGECSACKAFKNHPEIDNDSLLKSILYKKIEECRKRSSKTMQIPDNNFNTHDVFKIERDVDPNTHYHCVVGFSGGKDSVFLAHELITKHNLNILLVLDDVQVHSEKMFENLYNIVKQIRKKYGGKKRIGFVRAGYKKNFMANVRSNFLKQGMSFCRACLRSHFGMMYREAINFGSSFCFLGMTREQILTDVYGIKYATDIINYMQIPIDKINREELMEFHRQRAIVSNIEAGYKNEDQHQVFDVIGNIYTKVPKNQDIPMIVPYFLFIPQPDIIEMKKVIAEKLGWRDRGTQSGILAHTSCKYENLAAVLYQVSQGSISTKLRELAVLVRQKKMTLNDSLSIQINERKHLSITETELIDSLKAWGMEKHEMLKFFPKINDYITLDKFSISPNNKSYDIYSVRLTSNEDLIEFIVNFLSHNKLEQVKVISCVGSFKQVALKQQGNKNTIILNKNFEIVSIKGDISTKESNLQATFSDSEGKTYKGLIEKGSIINTTTDLILQIPSKKEKLINQSLCNEIILHLKAGDDLLKQLTDFVSLHKINAGFIRMDNEVFGHLNRTKIRFADSQNYLEDNKKEYTIISLGGILSENFVHIQILIQDNEGKLIGGHLKDGCVLSSNINITIGNLNKLIFGEIEKQDLDTNFVDLEILNTGV